MSGAASELRRSHRLRWSWQSTSRAPLLCSWRQSGEEIETRIQAQFDNSATGAFNNVRAVLVTAGGKQFVERYYESSAEATSNTFSVTKSVRSMLVGMALDEEHLDSVDQTLDELLPSYADEMSLRTKAITLCQLLTMTGGLPSNLDYLEDFATNRDWVGVILSDGPSQPPGQRFLYSNDGSHLLSAILIEATGHTTLV